MTKSIHALPGFLFPLGLSIKDSLLGNPRAAPFTPNVHGNTSDHTTTANTGDDEEHGKDSLLCDPAVELGRETPEDDVLAHVHDGKRLGRIVSVDVEEVSVSSVGAHRLSEIDQAVHDDGADPFNVVRCHDGPT